MSSEAIQFSIGGDNTGLLNVLNESEQRVSQSTKRMKSDFDRIADTKVGHGKGFDLLPHGAERRISEFLPELGKMATGLLSVDLAVETVRASIEKFAKIGDLAESNGLSVEYLQRLGNAAGVAGGDIDTIAAASIKLSKNIQFGKAADLSTEALSALGLELKNLRGMSAEDQFSAVSKALMGIEDPGQRAAAAVAVFGKSGASLIPTLHEIATSTDKVSVLTKRQVEDLKSAEDWWTRLGQKVEVTTAKYLAFEAAAVGRVKDSPTLMGKVSGLAAAILGGDVTDDDPLKKLGASGTGTNEDGEAVSPRGRKANGTDFAALLQAQEDEKATATRQAANERLIAAASAKRVKRVSDAVDAEKQGEQKIADLQARAADVRHATALADMDDAHRLNALLQDRIDLVDKEASATDKQGKAKISLDIAQKDSEIAATRRQIVEAAERRRDDAKDLADKALADAAERNKHLPSELRMKDFEDDSSNYDHGRIKSPGTLRDLERRADLEKSREEHRRNRTIGNAPKSYQPGAAEMLARERFPDFSKSNKKASDAAGLLDAKRNMAGEVVGGTDAFTGRHLGSTDQMGGVFSRDKDGQLHRDYSPTGADHQPFRMRVDAFGVEHYEGKVGKEGNLDFSKSNKKAIDAAAKDRRDAAAHGRHGGSRGGPSNAELQMVEANGQRDSGGGSGGKDGIEASIANLKTTLDGIKTILDGWDK